MAARRILNGTPGTTWRNDTGKVRWQALVNWRNSCGTCIQNDHAISTSKWPFPLHPRCMCAQLPIYPGKEGLPFVDFREEIDRLPAHRRADVIGKAALALVDRHVLRWPDVVTKNRVKPLHELVARYRLTVERMVAAGVSRREAQRAFDRAHGHDAEALAEAHRKAQEEAIAARAEAQRAAKEAARRRLAEQEAKVKARPRQPGVTGAEAGSAKVLADYLRKGNVKISAIEKVVAGRFGKINAEAEARRLREAEAAKKAKARRRAETAAEVKEKEAAARAKAEAEAERRKAHIELPPVHAAHVEDVRRRQMEAVEPTARKHSLTAQEYLDRSAEVLRSVAGHGVPSIRVRARTLDLILEEGRFKTQFEAGRSGGTLDPDLRRRVEEKVIGMPADTPDRERPVYGYLAQPGTGRLSGPTERVVGESYGEIAVRLHDRVKERARMTVGDTLIRGSGVAATSLSAPGVEALGTAPHGKFPDVVGLHAERGTAGLLDWLADRNRYVEIQVPGGVAVEDIAEVIFEEAPTAATVGALAARGIPWRVAS